MTEYTWMGDQDATSWDDLSVNNEADARQGKYRAILKYKDVVPMQEVTMEIVIMQLPSLYQLWNQVITLKQL